VSVSASVSESVKTKEIPNRFNEWIAPWSRNGDPDMAARLWISLVYPEHQDAAFACRDRYLASDEVARGIVMDPHNFISKQAHSGWSGKWPSGKSISNAKSEALDDAIRRLL
jgi:hypothetical protein